MSRPLLSICVPAYNRSGALGPLIDSVLEQEWTDWELVICEDASPEREQIRAVVARFAPRLGARLRYHENETNLGFDGNFRRLVSHARGEYLFIMGNDDLVCQGAFSAVADAAARYPDMGVLLRAYAFFRDDPANIIQINRYYATECSFPPGAPAVLACYRRIVAMSGLVLHRDSAAAVATDRFDGTLFYQHWLAANILCDRRAVYVPALLALFRKGGTPEFGNAEAERGKFTPGAQPPETDLRMLHDLFRIASTVEAERGVPIVSELRRDYARYMYPTFLHQAHRPFAEFFRFYRSLGRQGFARFPSFHLWFWAVALLGERRIDPALQWIRRRVGHTPNLSRSARPAAD
jgi:abequosyltransferase